MGKRMGKRRVIVGSLVAALLLMMGHARAFAAGSAEEFYRGKTLVWIVSTEPGAMTDVFARTIAPYLGREIGARVRVEDMKTDEGINYAYKQGSREGLTLVAKSTDAVIGNDILKAPGVLYETDKFNFVADVFPAVKLLQVSPKLPYKTLEELRRAKGLRAGATSTNGALALSAAVMFEVLGLDGKVITGYKGKNSVRLALARGEADFMVTMNTNVNDEKEGMLVNFMAVGNKRCPTAPQAPSLTELGVKIPKELENVHRFATTGGIAVALPPDVPQERVEYLRKAFQNINNNKDLQQAMVKLTGIWSAFTPGREMQEGLSAIKRDKGLAAKLDALFKKYSAVR